MLMALEDQMLVDLIKDGKCIVLYQQTSHELKILLGEHLYTGKGLLHMSMKSGFILGKPPPTPRYIASNWLCSALTDLVHFYERHKVSVCDVLCSGSFDYSAADMPTRHYPI